MSAPTMSIWLRMLQDAIPKSLTGDGKPEQDFAIILMGTPRYTYMNNAPPPISRLHASFSLRVWLSACRLSAANPFQDVTRHAQAPRAYGQRYAFSRNAEPVPTPLPIAVCSLFLTFSCFARLFCYVRLKNICEIFFKIKHSLR